MSFNIGDKVYYTSGKYEPTPRNPLKGSEYECKGVIIDTNYSKTHPYNVQWDNGHVNCYSKTDLSRITNDDSIRLL